MLNTNAPDPSAPLSLWILTIAIAVVYAVDLLLRFIAPRTKTTVDDKALSVVDRLLAWLKKLNPMATIAVVVLVAVATAAVACGPKASTTLHAIGGCAESAAEKDIIPAVASVLENGAPDSWEAELEALAIAYGRDLVICTVADVGEQEAAKQGGVNSKAAQAAARARAYLAKLSYHASVASKSPRYEPFHSPVDGAWHPAPPICNGIPLVAPNGDVTGCYDDASWHLSPSINYDTSNLAIGSTSNAIPVDAGVSQ